MDSQSSPYYTIEETRRRLRVSRTRLYGHIKAGELIVTRFGAAVRIHRDDLERFENAQRGARIDGRDVA